MSENQVFGYRSPVGPLRIEVASDGRLISLYFAQIDELSSLPDHPVSLALDKYFRTGEGPYGIEVKLAGTPFQQAVLRAIQTIPSGEVRSYTWLAAQAGSPRAVRAAGSAAGFNPTAIFVPCHRVVASRGLGGYGGGLDNKRFLLELESRLLKP
jgi:methylated-DNA-[protein]-cysteine S-methyltransferase